MRHWLSAVNDHSLQAPFVYDFYIKVLKGKGSSEDFLPIEAQRALLLKSKDTITVTSFGAKSRVNNQKTRGVRKIARYGITSSSTSQLLVRLIKYYNVKSLIELGTSFGLNSMYLAIDPSCTLTTFEGCPSTLNIARKNFDLLGYTNIKAIEGNIDEMLPQHLAAMTGKIDFAYLDANHQYAPTLNYFEWLYQKAHKNTVMVFDDIHWSDEMSRAWKHICADPRVTLSMDLFDLGLVFFKPELSKEHYCLRY